tara:strand:+ start:673 stop:2637 length:1965 start_codon:yes stop_codon:yes gene_type:complete
MELTLDEALKHGIEAHKSGQIQEAERFYTAILKAQPKHPDANHNMGVLAASVGKLKESLLFFKTALEANPSNSQFWLSYIDTLINLDQIPDAKAVFEQAKETGAKGELFDQMEKRLSELIASPQDPPLDQLQLIIDFYSQRQLHQALSNATGMLESFPKSPVLYNIVGASNAGLMQFDAAVDSYKQALKIKPDYAEVYNNMGIVLKDKGDLEIALDSYKQALRIKPYYAEVYNNMGIALKDKGDLEAAIDSFNQALKIKPDYAEAYYNTGITLKDKGDLEAAIDSFNQALKIKPDYAEVYNNMGIALKEKGDLEAAIGSFKQALKSKPDFAEVYNNMGIALKDRGSLEAAIDSYKQALKIKPDYAEVYYNMGIALKGKDDLEAAIYSYEQALKIKPDYASVAWNLSGTVENISGAKSWTEYCLKSDQNHLMAKLNLCALKFYEGDKSNFNELMQSSLKNHPFMRSYAWAFALPQLPELYFHRWALFDKVVEQSIKDRPFYEYGVWRGEAFQYLINVFKKGYGFDTFEGIPEDWHGEPAGKYSSDGYIPQIKGGEFIVGKFDDTLPTFFSEPRPMASVINFDADLYSSTICALNHSKPVIDQYTILIFDEFIMNKHWEQDEYKALNEFCLQNSYTFEVIAISFMTKQVAVRLAGI